MSAYVALPDPGSSHQTDELLLDDRTGPRRHDTARPDAEARRRSSLRLRVGFMNTTRALATATMVIGLTIVILAGVAAPIPKLSPLPSIIVVAVFAAAAMMGVALVVLVRDDQVERWASNLLFVVLCAVMFTIAAAFVALLYCNEDRLSRNWELESPGRRRHLTQELNRRRSFSALDEDAAGLVIVAETAMASLHFGVLCLILFGIEVAIALPLCLMQHVEEDATGRTPAIDRITRSLQEAGLI